MPKSLERLLDDRSNTAKNPVHNIQRIPVIPNARIPAWITAVLPGSGIGSDIDVSVTSANAEAFMETAATAAPSLSDRTYSDDRVTAATTAINAGTLANKNIILAKYPLIGSSSDLIFIDGKHRMKALADTTGKTVVFKARFVDPDSLLQHHPFDADG